MTAFHNLNGKRQILTTIILLFLLCSYVEPRKENNLLLKLWIYNPREYKYGDKHYAYIPQKKFQKYDDGMEFKKNGVLVMRVNPFTCGAEPVPYETKIGTWSNITDSIIEMKYVGWRDTITIRKKIVLLTKKKLHLLPIKQK
jgi:hypothetical protein